MTVMTQAPPSLPVAVDPDMPIELHKSDTPADRAFRLVLAAASFIVLAILVAVVVFLAVDGWGALHKAGTRFFTGRPGRPISVASACCPCWLARSPSRWWPCSSPSRSRWPPR